MLKVRTDMNTGKHPVLFYGWIIIAVTIMTNMLVYGVRHSFSVFFPEILNEFGWSRGSTSLMMSINVLIYGLMAPVSGTLSDRWKPGIMMPIGVIMLALAMAGCSLANRLWHFYILFGVFVPVGTALCGWPVLSPTIMNWFIARRGLVLGLAQMGGGLSIVYGLVAESLILRLGWRPAYLILAGILMVVLLPLHRFFFHYRPESKGLKAYSNENLKTDSVTGNNALSYNWTVHLILRSRQLWLLILSYFLYWGIAFFLVLAHQIKFTEDAGFGGMFSVSVFALFGIAMLVGQSCGAISDMMAREKAMALSSIMTIGGLLALISVRDTSHSWFLYLYALSFGFGAGLFTTVIFAGAADIFYGRHFGTASGMLLAGMGLGGAIGPWLGGYLYDISGSYDNAFILCMASVALAAASFWIAAPRNAHKLHARLFKDKINEASAER